MVEHENALPAQSFLPWMVICFRHWLQELLFRDSTWAWPLSAAPSLSTHQTPTAAGRGVLVTSLPSPFSVHLLSCGAGVFKIPLWACWLTTFIILHTSPILHLSFLVSRLKSHGHRKQLFHPHLLQHFLQLHYGTITGLILLNYRTRCNERARSKGNLGKIAAQWARHHESYAGTPSEQRARSSRRPAQVPKAVKFP